MAANVGSLIVSIEGNIEKLKQALDQAGLLTQDFGNKINAPIEQFQAKARASADALNSIGNIVLGIGGTIIAPFVQGFREVLKFDEALRSFNVSAQLSEQELGKFADQIKKMAIELPGTKEELLRIAQAGAQFGIAKEDLLEFTEVVVKMGAAAELTQEQAATFLGQISALFKTPVEEFKNLGSVMAELVATGNTTGDQIAEMALRIAGAGKTVGLAEADVLAVAAALSNLGINAEAGGSAISRVFLEMQKAVLSGGKELDTFAKVAGMSVENFKKLFQEDAAKALDVFIQGLGNMQKSGGDVIGTLEELGLSDIRVRDAVLRLAISHDELTKTLQISREEMAKSEALNERFGEKNKGFAATWEKLRDSISVFLQTLFENIKPAVEPAIKLITFFINKLTEIVNHPIGKVLIGLTAGFGSLILAIGGILKVSGLFLGEVSKILKAILDLKKIEGIAGFFNSAFSKIISILTSARPMIQGLITSIGGILANPAFWGVAGAIAVVGGLILAWKNDFLGFRTFITETVPKFFSEMKNKLSSVFKDIAETASIIVSGFKERLIRIEESLSIVLDKVKVFGKAVKDAFFNIAIDWINSLMEGISQRVVGLGEFLRKKFFEPIRELWSSIKQWGAGIIDGFLSGIESMLAVGKKRIKEFLSNLIPPFLRSKSPPEEGPLAEIDLWGRNLALTYIDEIGAGFEANRGLLESALAEGVKKPFEGVKKSIEDINFAFVKSIKFSKETPIEDRIAVLKKAIEDLTKAEQRAMKIAGTQQFSVVAGTEQAFLSLAREFAFRRLMFASELRNLELQLANTMAKAKEIERKEVTEKPIEEVGVGGRAERRTAGGAVVNINNPVFRFGTGEGRKAALDFASELNGVLRRTFAGAPT